LTGVITEICHHCGSIKQVKIIDKVEEKMLSTQKITNAFEAICEEVEKLEGLDLPDEVKQGLKSIHSIAKHQNDVRGAKKGSCASPS
jgi:hypothetical protein